MRIFLYITNGLLLIGLSILPTLAAAAVTVIHDSGDTRPLAPYLALLDGRAPAPRPPPSDGALLPSGLGAADPRALLPIRSPGLSPGPVQARSHHRPFTRPVFLIGADGRSRRWLVAQRDRLAKIGAVGMLVQAQTLDDLQTTASLAGGLPILPAAASDIAAALGIEHYPVLITATGIEQ